MAAGNTTFTTFVTSTLRNYRPTLVENLMGQQALFWQLKRRGFIREQTGGRSIVQPLMYGKNSTVKSYAGYDLLDVTPQLGITAAEYSWKFLSGSVSITGEEEFKNRGDKTRIFSLLEAKIRQLELSFKLELNKQLYAVGTANGGKDITGLALAVEDGTSWSTYGGIDASDSDNSWWRNQFLDFNVASTSFSTVAKGSVEGINAMRKVFNSCLRGKSKPTLIISSVDIYEEYETYVEGAHKRVESNAMADAGFLNIEFKGVPFIFDEDLVATGATNHDMLFLNSDFMSFVIGKGRNFQQTDFERAQQQDARSSFTLFAGNLTTSKRDQHGRIIDLVV